MKKYIYFFICFNINFLYLSEKEFIENFNQDDKFIIKRVERETESPKNLFQRECLKSLFEFNIKDKNEKLPFDKFYFNNKENEEQEEREDFDLFKRKVENQKKTLQYCNKISLFKKELSVDFLRENFILFQKRAFELKYNLIKNEDDLYIQTRGKKKKINEQATQERQEHSIVDNIFKNIKKNLDESHKIHSLIIDEVKKEEVSEENILEFSNEEEMDYLIYISIFYIDIMNKIESIENGIQFLEDKQKKNDQYYYNIIGKIIQDREDYSFCKGIFLKNIKYNYLNIFLTILTLGSVIGNFVYSNYQ